jgi:hypothetical protein
MDLSPPPFTPQIIHPVRYDEVPIEIVVAVAVVVTTHNINTTSTFPLSSPDPGLCMGGMDRIGTG